jgi:HD-like signal output (HDOD) protein
MTADRSHLVQLLKNVKDIPSLPDIAVRVMQMTRDPDIVAEDLDRVISRDPALTSNILRLCNSAYYGLPRVISSLLQAIMYLGFHTVRNLVLTCALSELMGGDRAIYGHGPGGLWTCSFACGVASQQLCRRVRVGQQHGAFTAGLLRDIGKVLIQPKIKDTESTLVEMMTERGLSLLEAERRTLGYTHTEIGAALADHWSFPHELVHAILHHHRPSEAKSVSLVTTVVHVADVMVINRGYGVVLPQLRYPLDDEAARMCKITVEMIEEVASDLDIHVTSISEVFPGKPSDSTGARDPASRG